VEAPKFGAGTGATFDRAPVAEAAAALIFFGVARRLIVSADTGLDDPVFLSVVADAVDPDAERDVLSVVVVLVAPLAKSDTPLLLTFADPTPGRVALLLIA
jgi:hypothetical protein